MKTQNSYITLGDIFVSRLLSGEIVRDTLPNHAIRYSGYVETSDKHRFLRFLGTSSAKELFYSLKSEFEPDSYEKLSLEELV
jgi:hypothetical protein